MPASNTPAPYCLTWDELHRDSRALAHRLLDTGIRWRGIVAVARGGLVPAAILARELDIRLVETLCIDIYAHDQQCDPDTLNCIDGSGEGLLLVDFLVDSGVTARLAREMLPHATIRLRLRVYCREICRRLLAARIHGESDVDSLSLGYRLPLQRTTGETE